MNVQQSADTYALIWNIKDSEMCTKGGCTKAGWYVSTCLGEDAQVWILVPWMYKSQFGVLCITGKDLTDNGTPWLEYKCRFHGQGVKDRSCMETEGEDIGDIAMLFPIKFRERGMTDVLGPHLHTDKRCRSDSLRRKTGELECIAASLVGHLGKKHGFSTGEVDAKLEAMGS